jgi:hypothetical protein
MHDDLTSLYAYNRWADRRVLDACRMLTPEPLGSRADDAQGLMKQIRNPKIEIRNKFKEDKKAKPKPTGP